MRWVLIGLMLMGLACTIQEVRVPVHIALDQKQYRVFREDTLKYCVIPTKRVLYTVRKSR